MIRNLYPSDFIFLLFHKEQALANEAGSCIFWDAEKAARFTYAPFFRQWLVPNERRFSWVYKDGNSIYGLISAKERATPLSWEIDYFLHSRRGTENQQFAEDISKSLLETLSLQAGIRGVRKVFFRSYSSSPIFDIIQSSNFKVYLKEYLFGSESLKLEIDRKGNYSKLFSPSGAAGYVLRPRNPADDDALYEMLFRMQPTAVKNAESTNVREWLETREKSCLREKGVVLQKGNSIVGWLGIRKGANWGHFRVMAYAPGKDNLDWIFLLAVSLLKNKKYIYCTVRDYQEDLKRLVEEKGFGRKEEFTLVFKEISITEKKPMLVSQQA